MKAYVKKKWLTALRSGEYTQGRYKLRHAGNFCCLGVLCNLHAQAHPEVAKTQNSRQEYLGHTADLPQDVWEWAGLGGPVGDDVAIGERVVSLDQLNDGANGVKRHNFAQIADIIEDQL